MKPLLAVLLLLGCAAAPVKVTCPVGCTCDANRISMWCPDQEMDVPAVESAERPVICKKLYPNGVVNGWDGYGGVTAYSDNGASETAHLRNCRGVDYDKFATKHSRSWFTCADKRRVLLTDEGGGKHCILFPPQKASTKP
jgi:hypothetical protein